MVNSALRGTRRLYRGDRSKARLCRINKNLPEDLMCERQYHEPKPVVVVMSLSIFGPHVPIVNQPLLQSSSPLPWLFRIYSHLLLFQVQILMLALIIFCFVFVDFP